MIIGVTGGNGAGKDAVADILKKMNFYHVSLSDFIREELAKNRIPITRDALISMGNELRNKYGPYVLAQRAMQTLRDGENYIFTSVRNPEEVRYLEQNPQFVLVEVIAPIEMRMKRILARGKQGDPRNVKELREKEAKEKSSDPNAQQLHTVAKMAKIKIINDASLEVLEKKVRKLVEDKMFRLKRHRPDWDHYFMNVAEEVKQRCTCLSAKKGAVLVKEKQIISTGYNGSPKDMTHCDDGGCPRCRSRHLGNIKSGVYSEPCVCVHAEANSILQAAYNGASTKNAIIYTTFTPCLECAKMIVNAGIREVVAKVIYPDDAGTKLLKDAGVKFRVLK